MKTTASAHNTCKRHVRATDGQRASPPQPQVASLFLSLSTPLRIVSSPRLHSCPLFFPSGPPSPPPLPLVPLPSPPPLQSSPYSPAKAESLLGDVTTLRLPTLPAMIVVAATLLPITPSTTTLNVVLPGGAPPAQLSPQMVAKREGWGRDERGKGQHTGPLMFSACWWDVRVREKKVLVWRNRRRRGRKGTGLWGWWEEEYAPCW